MPQQAIVPIGGEMPQQPATGGIVPVGGEMPDAGATFRTSNDPEYVVVGVGPFAHSVKLADLPEDIRKELLDHSAKGDQLLQNPLVQLAVGAAKGAGQTALNVGRFFQAVTPGLEKGVDALYGVPGISRTAMSDASQALTARGVAQNVGKFGEQIAEVVVPGSKIAALGKAVGAQAAARVAPGAVQTAARIVPRMLAEGAGGAAMSAAQGGDPRVGAVVGGAMPAIGSALGSLASKVPETLKEQAAKKVVQALGPTKERFKAIAERLAPQILQRGLGGSRASLQARAAGMMETVGNDLDAALQQYASQPISTQPVVAALEAAKDAFRTTNAAGTVVEFESRAIRQLDGLQKIVKSLGADATVEQLVSVRRAWDRVVDQAGGFAQRAGGAIGVPLKDQSEAWAKREATSAIRQALAADVPDLAAVNKEWSFWKNLSDVLTQTLQRTQAQGPGLLQQTAEVGGQLAGGLAGSSHGPAGAVGGAVVMGKLVKMATAAFRSPRWRLVDARMRDALADAIVGGKAGDIAANLARITAVESSKAGAP